MFAAIVYQPHCYRRDKLHKSLFSAFVAYTVGSSDDIYVCVGINTVAIIAVQ